MLNLLAILHALWQCTCMKWHLVRHSDYIECCSTDYLLSNVTHCTEQLQLHVQVHTLPVCLDLCVNLNGNIAHTEVRSLSEHIFYFPDIKLYRNKCMKTYILSN